jgi:Icc-related predicted phosphoesterase
VVHAPPSRTLVATRTDGGDAGDRDLVAAVDRYAPRLVLSGHVHSPLHWREHRDNTLFLNPGYERAAAFPNHILVQTEKTRARLLRAADDEVRETPFPVTEPNLTDNAAAAVAVA